MSDRPRIGMFRPSKEKGQNFLVDGNLARKFVRLLDPHPEDVVLEIGPGKGALTEPLLATGCRVLAIEIEQPLADELAGRQLERLDVWTADFLKISPEELAGRLPEPAEGGRLLALSNVPYSITGPVMARLMTGLVTVERFVVGVQLEVADRMAAPSGSRTYGRLSVVGAAWGTLKRSFKIAPQAYRPRPKVMSAAVLGIRDPEGRPMVPGGPLDKVIRAAFGQRRKTLTNSLSSGLALEKGQVVAALESAGLDPGLRAEAVDLAGYRSLVASLQAGGWGVGPTTAE